jgi:hypothetical protein
MRSRSIEASAERSCGNGARSIRRNRWLEARERCHFKARKEQGTNPDWKIRLQTRWKTAEVQTKKNSMKSWLLTGKAMYS